MPRLDSRVLAGIVLLSSCYYLTSATPLTSLLHNKRNTDTAVPQGNAGSEVEEVPQNGEMEPQPYTPDAFPPCVSVEYLTVLKDRFATQIDRNNDGRATFEEMRRHLQDYNPNVRDAAVAGFIARRDENGDGVIDFVPEYVKNVITPDYSVENAREWFNLDNTNGDEFVTRDELMSIARHIGTPEEQAAAQVSGYYLSNDKNGDDKLDWDEYKVIYGQ
ncbi:calmodulin-like protein 7 [Haliotis rufescens]|uniref:calmodulin-like protein 7 n=1 Tax=Haliotis rufescens TaxID=6454 RepID=UPI001EB056C1|nr:calmodulin-like protein 7 [Haliotis rufescens]XP_048247306.1 calmodulin-like protein 7 [Haliotis rufescens]